MKNIFLTSSIAHTGAYIGQQLNSNKQLSLVFVTTAAEAEAGDLSWVKDDRDCLIEGGFEVT